MIPAIFFWIFIVVAIIGSFTYGTWRLSLVRRIFKNLALKRNGAAYGNLNPSQLTFSYHDRMIVVWAVAGMRHEPAYTRVSVEVNNQKNIYLNIYGESFGYRVGKRFGAQDIRTGNSDFDDKYIVEGNNESIIRQLLTNFIQEKLIALREDHATVTLQKNELIVSMPKVLKIEEKYDVLIDTALLLVDRVQEI